VQQIYVGRDINLDPFAPQVMHSLGEKRGTNSKSKISTKQLAKMRPYMNTVYRQLYGVSAFLSSSHFFFCPIPTDLCEKMNHAGENFHIFFPQCQGCAHSKILLLIYPTFLRLVITSCNLMNIDTMYGDNHW
jgi:tyrosyl-DNA phosphodiesterase-1